MATIDLKNPTEGSPEWWLRRLLARLDARRGELSLWTDYYENRHPLSFFDEAIRERFGHRFARFASNFCALVVDGFAERLEVQGFRFAEQTGDEDVWAIWQENNLDAWSQTAHTDALVKGIAYALVDPNDGDPRITIEDAFDSIVEPDPRDNRKRLAALKRWLDPTDGRLIVMVYLPDTIYKYRSVKSWPVTTENWLPQYGVLVNGPTETGPSGSAQQVSVPAGGLEPYQPPGDSEWPLRNSLGVVPMVRLPNRPRLSGAFADGRSEIQPITSNQDLVNYYRAMAVVAARYLAMPQRYAINLETDIDAKTGQPKPPFKAGLADLWVVPPLEEDDPRATQAANQVTLGQFAPADLSPYVTLIQKEIDAIASITRMPYWYLMGEPQNVPPSGESLISSEAALVRKVRSGRIFLGEGWEEVMRVALKAKSDPRSTYQQAETIWANPATMNLAAVTDAIIKQRSVGLIDDETGREMLGYSPLQRKRIREVNPIPLPHVTEKIDATSPLSVESDETLPTPPAVIVSGQQAATTREVTRQNGA